MDDVSETCAERCSIRWSQVLYKILNLDKVDTIETPTPAIPSNDAVSPIASAMENVEFERYANLSDHEIVLDRICTEIVAYSRDEFLQIAAQTGLPITELELFLAIAAKLR